ncbi:MULTISPECIES: YHS domain-containing (seleno)protein [unclassified Flavobacterium]|uniref:YHS domain-containing (seleno)protein n=1 Tax=unclassified Flavobacterium TaxID=196869 RepID=UPI0012926BEF|nr:MULTISPECIES: YHS domain-containing (seleno)protein [unclassified Flavobacterium]MQP53533.1 YHS domain-containing protein [Flavobacterium sp. LMO9]MQP63518.1 YHS domain-containing protein [Flavobacterium sp. LMO6]
MKKFLYVFVLLVVHISLYSQNQSERIKHFNLENGIAIKGYDPVSYFLNDVKMGDKKISVKHQGATYYFSSQKNKELFLKSPSKYEPQYGGWCSFAMGDYGEKVEIDPKTFKILDGKLYLFYNAYFNNTLKSWNKNEKNLKSKADLNWAETLKK